MRWLTTLAIAACAAPAFAWDASGHELVVEIALKTCKPETAKKVRDLLATATWTDVGGSKTKVHDYTNPAIGGRFADDILPGNSQYGRNPYEDERYKDWHFIDLEVRDYARTIRQWPPKTTDGTVIQGIGDAIARIKGTPGVRTYEGGKPEALMFLLHFVGDIHQPLHCADNHDRGGHAAMRGPKGRLIPHTVWDGEATTFYKLRAANAGQSPKAQQKALAKIDAAADDLLETFGRGFSDAQIDDMNVLDWAKESYQYAYANIYHAPKPIRAITLKRWQNDARQRVTLAGLRLGRLLDQLEPSL